MSITSPRILIYVGLLTISLANSTVAAPIPIFESGGTTNLIGFSGYEDMGMEFNITFGTGSYNDVYSSPSLYDGDEAGATAAADELVDALNAFYPDPQTIGGLGFIGAGLYAAIPYAVSGTTVMTAGPLKIVPPRFFGSHRKPMSG